VVINAGVVAQSMKLVDMTADRMRRLFEINVLGAYLTAREAARRMGSDQGGAGGSMVVVSSAAARIGSPNEFVDYAGSKGAMDAMTLGLAKELGPAGIRVNAVRPGLIETDIHASAGDAGRVERLVSGVPLGRSGLADEVGETIVWLLSDAASYVSGALLDVGGGR
jgi:NAD(P)-dependent dehydrogenase (short-subunit alcohol dehydrogenase family)